MTTNVQLLHDSLLERLLEPCEVTFLSRYLLIWREDPWQCLLRFVSHWTSLCLRPTIRAFPVADSAASCRELDLNYELNDEVAELQTPLARNCAPALLTPFINYLY